MNKLCGWVLALAGAAMLAGCGDNNGDHRPDAGPDAAEFNFVERGAYIVNTLGACSFCHTPLLEDGSRDLTRQFAGVDCFIDINSPTFVDNGDAYGCLSTRNLTPDATGLGNATDAQIKDAFQNGHRTDGKNIFPIMPWYIFHNMTDQDADSVVAFLRSLPAVEHTVKANEQPFADYNDGKDPTAGGFLPFPVTPLLDNQIPYPIGGTNNAAAMHGRYLSSMTGLCIDCHTPEVFPNTIKLNVPDKAFAGGKVFPKGTLGLIDTNNTYPALIATRNLTPDATGLMGWTKDEIKAAIKDGKDRDGKGVCAATHGGMTSPYAALTDGDLDDIVEYLQNLPAIDNDTANDPAAANCGAPPMPDFDPANAETLCDNGIDEDLDGVPDDGCPVACGNCQGPTVQ